jgi:hypothetical protein
VWAANQVGSAHWQVGGSSSRPDPLVWDGGEPGRWGPRGTHVSQAPERGVGAATLERSWRSRRAIDRSNSMHVGPKKKMKQINFGADLFVAFAEQSEVEWRPIGSRLPIDQNDDETNSEGIEDALMSSIRASWRAGWPIWWSKKRRIEEKVGRVATWWETGFSIGQYDEENKRASKTHS